MRLAEGMAFDEDLLEAKAYDPSDARRTQRANTLNAVKSLKDEIENSDVVVDVGAGLGLSKTVDPKIITYEPYPKFAKEEAQEDDVKFIAPSFTEMSALKSAIKAKGGADLVFTNYVLNVIHDVKARAQLVKDIGSLLKKGGIAVITTRSQADVNSAKQKDKQTESGQQVHPEDEHGWFIRNGDGYSFQKGFTPAELATYVENILGDKFEVKIRKFTSISPRVVVTKL